MTWLHHIEKMTMLKLFVPIIILLFYTGTCTEENFGAGLNDIPYKECREFDVGNYICFDSVITDSRCPVNVICIWAGEAIAGFRTNISGENYYLHIRVGEDTIVGDYKIIFEDLLPYRDTRVEFETEDYRARIFIEN